jgi:predicted nucleic acid binding AN1-type Zn finger protein
MYMYIYITHTHSNTHTHTHTHKFTYNPPPHTHPGAVIYTLRPIGNWKLWSVAKAMDESGDKYAPALFSTTVPGLKKNKKSGKSVQCPSYLP